MDSSLTAMDEAFRSVHLGPRIGDYVLWSAEGRAYWNFRQDWWAWTGEPDLTIVLNQEVPDSPPVPLTVCRLFKRKARCRGTRISCIGIGGVFTPENLRGKGHASRMLTMLMDEMRERRVAPLAVLFAQDRTLYERLGFVKVRESGKFGFLMVASLSEDIEVFPSKDWTIIPGDHF